MVDVIAPKGSAHPLSKLNEKQVADARASFRRGASFCELAKKYGVTRSTMGKAISGDTFKHVPLPCPRRYTGKGSGTYDHRGTNGKMTKEQVKSIRKLARKGLGPAVLARQFGLSTAAMTKIIKRRTFTNI